jgi:type II secretory pathway component PulJ
MKLNSRGLTLVELLVAFVISTILIIGVYTVFNSVVDISDRTKYKNDFNIIKNKLMLLLNQDINSSLNENPEKSDFFDEKFSIVSFNSLFFNRSIPVTVVYGLEDNYLVRKEINSKMAFEQSIKLVNGIKDFEVLYYDGNEYVKEKNNKSSIYKFIVYTENGSFEIIAGKLLL